ncbi:xanthine dehydrogenase family protein subunit M [Ferrovibrio sp.]|uniref:FAD binding domain-containing protein n=1 Tax=Ferrovibrio sp. TaxID=1917215 RepID=UPI0035AF9798
MKPNPFELLTPTTIEAALQYMQEYGDRARIIAGGQSLVPMMNFRLAAPEFLIDISRIAELRREEWQPDGALLVGAMTTHRYFERSARVAQNLPLLADAVLSIAHVQIRNRGTIGGSLAHSDPAAEWPALCIACDATMLITGPAGSREVAADDFNLGTFASALEADEMLTAIRFPAWPSSRGWGFQEISRRLGDFALAGTACVVDFDPSGQCKTARIALFGVEDRPILASAVNDSLIGQRLNDAVIRQAAALAADTVEPRSDMHASAEYRRDLVNVLVRRALTQAATTRQPEAA